MALLTHTHTRPRLRSNLQRCWLPSPSASSDSAVLAAAIELACASKRASASEPQIAKCYIDLVRGMAGRIASNYNIELLTQTLNLPMGNLNHRKLFHCSLQGMVVVPLMAGPAFSVFPVLLVIPIVALCRLEWHGARNATQTQKMGRPQALAGARTLDFAPCARHLTQHCGYCTLQYDPT